jgi:hypothetical protein
VIRYTITEHPGRPGAYLSKRSHWGNIPFADAASAREAADDDACGADYTIERKTGRAKMETMA